MVQLQRRLLFLACFVLATALMGCAAALQHERTGPIDGDTAITTKVKAAILDAKTLQVYVRTNNGVVLLSGVVDSAQRVTTLGNIARSIENVVSVENDLVVNCGATSNECEIRSPVMY
ncbi:MAG: BON domain-containing protein [Desulfuromonadales bacterium]|nr:BON domain-containing protein [Desulfuromonadales bacterium]